MKDLTQGSIVRNILAMAAPMALGMIFQTFYFLVDLYFVAGLGDAAVAGVGAAGTLMFVIMALTQVLGVGAVALIAQAVGRKDRADANLVFNQSVLFAVACAVATSIGGYALAERLRCVDRSRCRDAGRRACRICIGSCRDWRSASRRSSWAPRCAALASSNPRWRSRR